MHMTKPLSWHNETRKVSDLIPYQRNPRRITEDQMEYLKASLKKYNLVDVPTIDADGVLVSGHQRARALSILGRGDEEIDVRVPNRKLTEEEFKHLNIEANKLRGAFDFDMLSADFNLEELRSIGFSEAELGMIDFGVEDTEKDDAVPEIPETPLSKLGDLYEIGNHRVLCGDSTKEEDVDKLMNGSHADMCFTDPPYNIDYTGGAVGEREGILNDHMSSSAFKSFLADALRPIVKYTDGGIYVCMSSAELSSLKDAFELAGGHWQSYVIWVKNNFTMSRADYQNTYEPMLYGWRDNVVNHYFTERRDIANVWEDLSEVKTEYDGENTTIAFQGFKVRIKGKVEKGEVIRKKQHTDIWRYDKPIKSELHPTQKPINLVTEAITNSSKHKQIVLDTFLGSGSTLIAAEKTGRKCYGMELDPKFVDVIVQRYVDYTGNAQIRKNGEDIVW